MDINAVIVLAAVLGATITGCFTYLNILISRDNKISDFRQQWINEVRGIMVRYGSLCNLHFQNLSPLGLQIIEKRMNGPEGGGHIFDAMKNNTVEMIEALQELNMRINQDDTDETLRKINLLFLASADQMRAILQEGLNEDSAAFATIYNKYKITGRALLKHEWERLKKGEGEFARFRNLVFGLTEWASILVGTVIFTYIMKVILV